MMDMGLTQAQVDKITSEWQQTVDAVHESLVKAGKFNWHKRCLAQQSRRKRAQDSETSLFCAI